MSTSLPRFLVLTTVLFGAAACAPSTEEEEDVGGATSNLDRADRADRSSDERSEPTASEKLRDAYLAAYRRARTSDFQDFRKVCQNVEIGRPITPDDEIWRWHIGLDAEIRRGLQIALPVKTTGPLYALLVETVVGSEVEMHLFPEGTNQLHGCASAHPFEFLSCRFAKGSIPDPSECTLTQEREQERARRPSSRE